jgi:hypothetical protein
VEPPRPRGRGAALSKLSRALVDKRWARSGAPRSRSWSAHDDSEVSVLRDDVPALAPVLSGWGICVAAAGVLTPWNGSPLSIRESQNNVWCRKVPGQPWCLDVTISDGDRDHWIYRRNPTLRAPWDEAVLRSEGEVPVPGAGASAPLQEQELQDEGRTRRHRGDPRADGGPPTSASRAVARGPSVAGVAG